MDDLKTGDLFARMRELPSVRPQRYVWHVAHRGYGAGRLEEFSIARRGILGEYCRYGRAVFAHNGLSDLSDFYPFNIDLDAYDLGSLHRGFPEPSRFLLSCSFWRIDTRLFRGRWYVDPNLKSGRHFGSGIAVNYLCTPEDIPPQALKCYVFDLTAYLCARPDLMSNDETLLQTSFLRPDPDVNRWIGHGRQAA